MQYITSVSSFILSQLRKHHTYNSKELLESVNNFIAKISFLAINFYIHVSVCDAYLVYTILKEILVSKNTIADEGLTKTNYQNYQKVSSDDMFNICNLERSLTVKFGSEDETTMFF